MDVACLQAGRYIEGKLAERDNEGRPLFSLEGLLRGEGPGARSEERFASMSKPGLRKVRIREDGTWE